MQLQITVEIVTAAIRTLWLVGLALDTKDGKSSRRRRL
ncbi:hypothetical protein EDD76_11184 [Kineothrix alysoides]|uniref:Uncharacterized protein n=1 Tax=Kineothrix alysoides TaxID=1469948 RepID=A0A4R1QY06_9FIRM|nr:hypothetical protein EDD76_11184 [Kineothrix alysoides]